MSASVTPPSAAKNSTPLSSQETKNLDFFAGFVLDLAQIKRVDNNHKRVVVIMAANPKVGEQEQTVKTIRFQYTPFIFARTSFIHLYETGILTVLQMHASVRENLCGYLLIVVKSEFGMINVGWRAYDLNPDDVTFIDCL